jgi:hypothetical protein
MNSSTRGFVERWEKAALFPAFLLAKRWIGSFVAFRTMICVWASGPIVELLP